MSVTTTQIENGIRLQWITNNHHQSNKFPLNIYNSNPFQIKNQFYYLHYLGCSLSLNLHSNSSNGTRGTQEQTEDEIVKLIAQRNNADEREMVKRGPFQWDVSWSSYSSGSVVFTVTACFKKTTIGGGEFILRSLEQLLEKSLFTDVQFIVQNQEMNAHRAILAAASPVLATAFENNWKEGQIQVMEITDTKPEIFQQFLKFLYTGEAPRFTEDDITEGLFILADKYQIDFLKNACAQCLRNQIKLANVLRFLVFSDRYTCSGLEDICLQFISSNSKEVISLPEWKELVRKYPELTIKVTQSIVNGSNSK